jgi:hypothetical protein
MRAWLTVAAVLLVSTCGYAQGRKSCEELKPEINQKVEAKGVKGYSLEIVEKNKEVGDAKVVGTCDGGAKKIVYQRTATTPQTPAKKPSKP